MLRYIFLLTFFLCTIGVSTAQSVYDVTAFGAVGDGVTDDAAAIQRAIDQCNEDGGGCVIIPRGKTFMAGPVELKANVELHLEATATLMANPDESIYHLSAFGENEGEGMMWLYAHDADNLSITGKGTIHGNGIRFMGAELEDSYELKPVTTFDPRPHVLTLIDCDNLTIRDVTIREGAYWTVHLIGCDGAVIDGIQLLNNLKIRNGDGIDLDHSRHVRISNCHITSGDDCVCLKNRREYEEYGSCHDIVVTNCTMASRSCAIKIGSENMDSIYNVLFDNCIITGSNRGLGIQNRDEGTVSDIVFSNIVMELGLWSDVWWGKAEPIYVTSYPRANANHKDANWRFPKGQTEGRCGNVSRIVFSNITAISENGCFVGADQPGRVTDITFSDVNIHLKRPTHQSTALMDKRPCKGDGFLEISYDELFSKPFPLVTENAEVEVKSSQRLTPEQTGGVYYAYPVSEAQRIDVPEGMEVFYVSHYGRHGSRWVSSKSRYQWVKRLFADESRLTPLGRDVKRRLDMVFKNARGNAGSLTPLGAEQHRQIARRMAVNYPDAFRGKDVVVTARSSISPRCRASMRAFCSALESELSDKKINQKTNKADMAYISYDSPELVDLYNATKRMPTISTDRFVNALFTDGSHITDRPRFLYEMHTIASDMQDIPFHVSLWDIFTYEELMSVYDSNNERMNIVNGADSLNGGVAAASSVNLWRHIEQTADEYIANGRHGSSLIFGHDTPLFRLLSLLQADLPSTGMDFVLPMAANVQFVFMKNRSGEVFVSLLHNERQLDLPVQSAYPHVYRWSELKAYMNHRISLLTR